MASDPPPHGTAVDLEGSTALTTILPPVTAQAAEAIVQASEGWAAEPTETFVPAVEAVAHDVVTQASETTAGVAAAREASVGSTSNVEGQYLLASDALIEFNLKVAESMQANIESTMAFWTSMMGTKSLSDAVALNAQHIRKQMEALTSQGRELSTIARKLAAHSMEPLHAAFFKGGSHK